MPEPADLLKGIPVIDNHVHFRPDGRMEEALKEFSARGGKRLLLVHTPYPDLAPSVLDGFQAAYGRTLAMAEQARKLGSVEVRVALGPHPVEILALEETMGIARAVEMMQSAFDLAAQHVQEGTAVALGEVGRPHFGVSDVAWEASNELVVYGMRLAKEVDCPIILHTEEATPEVLKEFALMADDVGLSRGKVVKHYCGPLILPEENHGVFPSVLARGGWARQASEKGLRFLLETDYLDDPRRPGAVLGLGTVPKRCAALLAEGVLDRESLYRIHDDNVKQLYRGGFTS